MLNSSPKFEFCFDDTKGVHVIKKFPFRNFQTIDPMDLWNVMPNTTSAATTTTMFHVKLCYPTALFKKLEDFAAAVLLPACPCWRQLVYSFEREQNMQFFFHCLYHPN